VAEGAQHGLGGLGGDEEVQVAHRLAPAPHAARGLDAPHAGDLAQARAEGVRVLQGAVQRHAPLPLAVARDGLEDALDPLLPHARQPAHAAGAAAGLQRVDRGHAQALPRRRRRLGADALHREQVQHPRGHARSEPLLLAAPPGREDLLDGRGQLLAYRGQALQLASPRHLHQGLRVGVDDLRRLAVGPHPVGVAVGDLEDVGDLPQHPGDVCVLHGPSR
jgi:hypothetical protein